jgi:hypothetical protein
LEHDASEPASTLRPSDKAMNLRALRFFIAILEFQKM